MEESDYDLLILGAIGQGAVKQSKAGSVCERVLRRAELDTRLETLLPDAEIADESLLTLELQLEEAEALADEHQQQWEAFSERDRDARHRAEREQETIRRLERQLEEAARELERRRQQRSELPDVSDLEAERDALREDLAMLDERQQALEIRPDYAPARINLEQARRSLE